MSTVAFALLLPLSLGLPCAGPAQAAEPQASTDGTTVQVSGGSITGSIDLLSGRRQFLGVPYAAAPTGTRRFRAPQPVTPWSGTRSATSQGNACPQVANPVQPVGSISEDCLVLNVYAPPAAASRHLPVMVYIPGGGFQIGSIAQYDPAPLVATGKVIVVEVNYRVGPMGFLALPGLAREGGGSGNYGLLDQQAALRWVQANATAFGGDPRAVTLFGESAGGQSVCDQLSSPAARGLFARAIIESGGCARTRLIPASLAAAEVRGKKYADSVGCPDGPHQVACLRALPLSTLYKDQSATVSTITGELSFLPTIDGVTLTATPERALRAGSARGIPIMQGSNHDESRLFIALANHLSLKPFTSATYQDYLRKAFGAQAGRVLAEYPVSNYRNADLAAAAVSTDSDFACAGAVTTEASAAGGSPTWQYEFDGTVPILGNADPFFPEGLGSFHGSELYYLFSTSAALPTTIGLDSRASTLSKQMIDQWTTFARTGNPNGSGKPRWARYRAAVPRVLKLAPEGSSMIANFGSEHHCSFWANLPS